MYNLLMANVVYYDSLGWDTPDVDQEEDPNPVVEEAEVTRPVPKVRFDENLSFNEPRVESHVLDVVSLLVYIMLFLLIGCSLWRCMHKK